MKKKYQNSHQVLIHFFKLFSILIEDYSAEHFSLIDIQMGKNIIK